MRTDLRPVQRPRDRPRDDDVELCLLVVRRSELVADHTGRAARVRVLLASIHPGLKQVVDPTAKPGLHPRSRSVTAAEIRSAGHRHLLTHLRATERVKDASITTLADAALAAAHAQLVSVSGDAVAAELIHKLIHKLAREALASREQLHTIDQRITAVLARHPDAAFIRSLPGMGATLTGELLAITGGITRFPSGDQLAAAAGLARVLKQSGTVRYLQRATAGDKALKRVCYQSAFVALGCHPASKASDRCRRSEGKTHHQAVVALARRSVNVLHAILRTRRPHGPRHATTAA